MRKQEFWGGVRDELPLLLGVVPFCLIYGVLAVGAGIAPLPAQAMSAILFAGSAQFITVQLVGAGAPWLVMVATAFMLGLLVIPLGILPSSLFTGGLGASSQFFMGRCK